MKARDFETFGCDYGDNPCIPIDTPLFPVYWYVEPIPPFDNQVISSILPEENALTDVLCGDKKRHNLWLCTSIDSVLKLESAERDLDLHFIVWVKIGRHGVIKRWGQQRRLESLI